MLAIRIGDRDVKPELEDLLRSEVKMAVKTEKMKMMILMMIMRTMTTL
jgi:hypothetical protein